MTKQTFTQGELRVITETDHVQCGDASAMAHMLLAVLAERDAVAAENAALKAAFDKPDAWLSWHSIPPTFYEPDRGGEYLNVHEAPGEKNDDGSDSWAVFRAPEIKSPATDAILASIRAEGVEMFVEHCKNSAIVKSYDFWMDASACAESFAAQLRSKSEVQS